MVDESPYKVCIVLDRFFGDRLVTVAQNGPVWIVDSPINQAAAQIYWERNPASTHFAGVTLFKAPITTSPEDALISNLSTIDLHHGEYPAPTAYSVLEVIGTSKTTRIKAAFAEYGFNQFKENTEGFRATRDLSHSVL